MVGSRFAVCSVMENSAIAICLMLQLRLYVSNVSQKNATAIVMV
jgi:hypothetical protein